MNESRWYPVFVRASDMAWRALAIVALLAVVVFLGVALAAIAVPVLLAVVVIPVGRPLYQRLERHLPRSAAAALVVVLALVVLGLATWLMIASIVGNWDALWSGISDAVAAVTKWIGDRANSLSDAQLATIQDNLRDLAATIASVLVGGTSRSVAVIGAFFVGFFLFIVTFFFGVRDWESFRDWAVTFARPSLRAKTRRFLDESDSIMRKYWKSQTYIGIFDALAMGGGLALIGVPLALPIAIFSFVISFIPYAGAVVSTALAVLVALGTGGSGDALMALLLSLFVFNTGENLIRPWVVGETVNMPTFVAFLASMVGVLVAGALGAILAIPVVALVREARRTFFPIELEEAAEERTSSPTGEPGGDPP